jgi:ribonuclease T1
MHRWLCLLLALGGLSAARADTKPPPGVPEKAMKVLEYVDKNDKAPDGYEGGRHFGNFEKLLPMKDAKDRSIKYREWDVNPLKPGVNRGPERLITGSDNSAYYTDDHYKSFKKIR